MIDFLELNNAAKKLAVTEIEKYGLPTKLHFDISYEKGIRIAEELNADVNLVGIGVSLMDLKLGKAFQEKKLAEHVKMSAESSKVFLNDYSLDDDTYKKILNCIEAHHGKIPFECLEAEITANADCYRFIHPTGVLHYIGTLTKRGFDIDEIVNQVEAKLDEKWNILSLEYCKNELSEYYENFKSIFAETRK